MGPRGPRLRPAPTSGRVDPYRFITGRIGLDDLVAKGFRELIDDKEENVEILVQP